MGIPGFSTWFSNAACPQAFVSRRVERFDHVFVDVASILHKVARKARTLSRAHKLIYSELDAILLEYQPTQSVFLAMDGPAPLAKLITQRSRRSAQGRRESKVLGKGISAMGLTPGTELMLELEESLAFYISQRLQTRWSHLHFELSGATVAGEGELKIFGRILRPLRVAAPGDQIAVVGSDSDLYLLAMLQEAVGGVWVVPDNIRSGARSRAARSFSLAALEGQWRRLQQIGGSGSSEGVRERLRALKADLAAISVIASGNDYLPGILGTWLENRPAGRGLWDVYLGMRCSPKWKDRKLVLPLGSPAPGFDVEFLHALLQKQSNPGIPKRDGWTLRKPLPDPGHYLQGLRWMLDMYVEGRCTDYRYVYDAQAPTCTEVLEHLTSWKAPAKAAPGTQGCTAAPSPAVCALALLPATGRQHAPQALQPLMDPGSPIAELYAVCEECEEHRERGKEGQLELNKALKELAELDQETPAPSAAGRDAVSNKVSSLRSKARQLEHARLQHVLAMHRYERFPIDRIEDAVAGIPAHRFTGAQRRLLRCGTSKLFWKHREGEPCCCGSCRGTGQACLFTYLPPEVPGRGLARVTADGLRCAPVAEEFERGARRENCTAGESSTSCQCPNCWRGVRSTGGLQMPTESCTCAPSHRRAPSRCSATQTPARAQLPAWLRVGAAPLPWVTSARAGTGGSNFCSLSRTWPAPAGAKRGVASHCHVRTERPGPPLTSCDMRQHQQSCQPQCNQPRRSLLSWRARALTAFIRQCR